MVSLQELKLASRKEFLRCLDLLPGSKTIIWDQSLTAPFTNFTDFNLLRNHGVEKMVMLPDNGRIASLPTQSAVFLCSDSPTLMDKVCNSIAAQSTTEYHMIIIPRLSAMSMKMLKEKNGLKKSGGPAKLKSVIPCQIDLYIISPYIFTLNMQNSFLKMLDDDQVLASNSTRALATLQVAFGIFPHVLSLGKHSTITADVLLEKRREFDALERKRTGPNQISTLIILDRSVDIVSPLLTPSSYYALLAEELKLKWGSVTLPGAENKPKKISLSSDEPINEELADIHVKKAAKIISQKLRTLKAAFDERHEKKTVAEYKAFVQMMPQLNKERDALTAHSEMCSKVIGTCNKAHVSLEYESLLTPANHQLEKLWTGEVEVSMDQAYRLFCLSSWRCGGLPQKIFDTYKQNFLNIYGYSQLKTIMRLELNGFIKVQSDKSHRQLKDTLIKTLKLNQRGKDIFNPTNPSYVFDSFWNPITARLVHEAISGSWRRISELLNHFDHPYQETPQNIETKAMEEKPGIVVFIIGGVTYAEISALRNLSNQLGMDIIVGSTEIISTSEFLEQIKNHPY